jgi:hypothetical protein
VLDLATFAGGLRATRRGGGEQTKSLRLQGADGKEYSFRSVNKDPSGALPPELRETAAADIVRDQTSAAHPAGALIVAPIFGPRASCMPSRAWWCFRRTRPGWDSSQRSSAGCWDDRGAAGGGTRSTGFAGAYRHHQYRGAAPGAARESH